MNESMRVLGAVSAIAALAALSCGHSIKSPDMDVERTWRANVKPYRRKSPKVGRNAPCPCGSGKKNKKCHNHK